MSFLMHFEVAAAVARQELFSIARNLPYCVSHCSHFFSAAKPSTSPMPAAAEAAPTDSCTPIAGFTTGFESNQWNPFSLKQQGSGNGFLVRLTNSNNTATGLSGAAVTVTARGAALWHVQLSSVPAKLSAGKYYMLKYTAKSSEASFMQVALVSDITWKVSSNHSAYFIISCCTKHAQLL
jgi:hypothetical protein